jgi:hypothetical protein
MIVISKVGVGYEAGICRNHGAHSIGRICGPEAVEMGIIVPSMKQ